MSLLCHSFPSRLLFVGMTRAQCFLYCLHVVGRLIPGRSAISTLKDHLILSIWSPGFSPYFNANGLEHQFTPFLLTVPEELVSSELPNYTVETETMLKELLGK